MNRQTAETNFLGALAQCEAAMAVFRAQNAGHLVVISSMAALRGLPGNGDHVRGDEGGGGPRWRRASAWTWSTPRSG